VGVLHRSRVSGEARLDGPVRARRVRANLTLLFPRPGDPYDLHNTAVARHPFLSPLSVEVKEHCLWACHLGPELGGQAYGH